MARFYFQFREGAQARDTVGLELGNVEEARREAITSIMEIAKGDIPASERKEWIVNVHDDTGPVLEVRLTLNVTTTPRS